MYACNYPKHKHYSIPHKSSSYSLSLSFSMQYFLVFFSPDLQNFLFLVVDVDYVCVLIYLFVKKMSILLLLYLYVGFRFGRRSLYLLLRIRRGILHAHTHPRLHLCS